MMKKLINWLSVSFAPKASEIFSKPVLSAISSSMQKVVPFILTGSLIFFYNVIKTYITFLPDLSPIANFSFGLLTLIVTFMIANQCLEKLKHPEYTVNGGLAAIGVLMMVAFPTGENQDSLNHFIANLGPSGMAVGMIVGLIVSFIFHIWGKIKFLQDSSIPDFVVSWINFLIPNIIVLGASMLVVNVFGINLYQAIINIFMPISSIAQTLPGFIIISLLYAFFYTLGISSWLWNAVTTPIFMTAINENIELVNAGKEVVNIVTSESFFTLAFITMGGVCATLALNILMCFSKSNQLKMLGRVFIAPSIFNINEPLMFGAPVVFNPILMLPAWINAVVGPVYVWTLMKTGLLNIPSKMIQVGQIPAPASSVMITEDLRAILWWAILLLIYTSIWYPFFKVFEKEKIDEELAS
ncbi:Lichenan permease IIC component [Streptococcus constellatus]|uniref:Permease IIC component n=1 Tax=Streptococcus constellatus TaxID=76860 RepID=A0A564TPK5_STRCV|nr:PTS transporter subunit EIIC [Streptococcus constellatus]VUX02260.1 Lichenan permease IIC component [Streptococcus gordonii]VUX09184.1 Lichenan permease IIC component [Streptococcus constellatus]